jgi:hypothetical protein
MWEADSMAVDDAWDGSEGEIDEVHLLIGDALIAARCLFDLHPDPALAGPMYASLRETLMAICKRADRLDAPYRPIDLPC